MCLDCSGYHRRLGVHISFVRSTDMDEWSEEQLLIMQLGGNEAARNFFKQHGVYELGIDDKYSSRGAQMYKQKLSQTVKTSTTPVFVTLPSTTDSTSPAHMDSAGGAAGLEALLVGSSLQSSSKRISLPARMIPAAAPTPVVTPAVARVPALALTPVVTLVPTPTPAVALVTAPAPARPMVRLTTGGTLGTTNTAKSGTLTRGTKKLGGTKKSGAKKLGARKLGRHVPAASNVIPFENEQPMTTTSDDNTKDDEALARALHDTELTTSLSSKYKPTNNMTNDSTTVENLDKYKNAKSISSANYFSSENNAQDRQQQQDRVQEFSSSQSISSDAYYGLDRRSSSSDQITEEAMYQMQQLKAGVSDQTQKIKDYTSGFFSDLQSRS